MDEIFEKLCTWGKSNKKILIFIAIFFICCVSCYISGCSIERRRCANERAADLSAIDDGGLSDGIEQLESTIGGLRDSSEKLDQASSGVTGSIRESQSVVSEIITGVGTFTEGSRKTTSAINDTTNTLESSTGIFADNRRDLEDIRINNEGCGDSITKLETICSGYERLFGNDTKGAGDGDP